LFLNVSANDFVLFFAGNEFGRKGLQTVVESLGQWNDSSVKLVVAGDDDPEPYRRAGAKFGVENQLRFLGKISGPEKFFLAADVFVLPTYYEPFGMVIIEAMAAGIPVITSAAAGAVEDLLDGVHGLYLDNPLSADELVEALRRIRGDCALAGELAANGLKESLRFSWDTIAEQTLAVYHRLPGLSGRAS
jgi:UDP-glucose:(heptosyl)LPS alpha-1,3-glucosyltransferase